MPVPVLSLYCRPDESWTIGATATADDTDPAYQAGWAVDGIPNRPFMSTEPTDTVDITFGSGSPASPGEIGGVAICNHNITPGSAIAIGGVVGTVTTAPAARPNGVPYNAWAIVNPVQTVTGISVTATAPETLIIGEIIAGKMREFPGGGLLINTVSGSNLKRGEANAAKSVRPYDVGEAARRWQSSVFATPDELDDMMAWFESQRNGSLPSLFIPDAEVNDAWVVELLEPAWVLEQNTQDVYRVTLTMQEYPRVRW